MGIPAAVDARLDFVRIFRPHGFVEPDSHGWPETVRGKAYDLHVDIAVLTASEHGQRLLSVVPGGDAVWICGPRSMSGGFARRRRLWVAARWHVTIKK